MWFLIGVFLVVVVAVALGVTYHREIATLVGWAIIVAVWLVAAGLLVLFFVLLANGTLKELMRAASPWPEIIGGVVLAWVLWVQALEAFQAWRKKREAVEPGRAPPP